jgi:hypothetical protein
MNRIILAERFMDALKEQGLIPSNCRRVVIDAEVSNPVHLYYECFGDERLLNIALTDGSHIKISGIECSKP